ncbi:MAG: nicotinate-nucleotide adenylyltransferase [Bacteroidia bacterium]|nr:nicotinate-nucleotide adenylyltransferase [Bacteroidia bacterium]NND26872.1 nicotinate-nucleotide adenylyltransferase [Flavobacteriaceae bacterium]NNK60727.1 nicotinate-nucleotide adenylyltransferase [Flavobacteriaceae bacterium]NNL34037.1 nicotinate-nucleotide adenylyltransferase [Flavobacteriaceae bacterium]
MKKLIIGLLALGLTTQINAQIIELDEVSITAVNYKYINAVDSDDVAVPVKLLQEKVALFDLKNAEFYLDEYDLYEVKFYIPDGKVLVAYDGNGKILRTIEKYKNVKLPDVVRNAIIERFPNWAIKKDVYFVKYNDGKSTQEYKVILTNGDKTMRVKLDAMGSFL